jgi:hypothetical protein
MDFLISNFRYYNLLKTKCCYFGKSGRTEEENPELLPNNGDVSGMMNEPFPADVDDGDVREGGDKVIGSDVEKVLLVGDDINGPISENEGIAWFINERRWTSSTNKVLAC